MEKVYAIQRLDNGQVFDYCETPEQASYWLNMETPKFELVPTNTSSIVVTYSELGGPHGYGHQEESFTTYGGIIRCIINLYKWMQKEANFWGSDAFDYFRHCSLYINNEDKTEQLLLQIDELRKRKYFGRIHI